jgi:hypothetical protein
VHRALRPDARLGQEFGWALGQAAEEGFKEEAFAVHNAIS